MNRIKNVFERAAGGVLSVFFTAGYPAPDSTETVGLALANAGVPLLEIGFPFSDSLVDGPTIQIANEQSLAAGMTFAKYFAAIRCIRDKSEVAMVAMCCLNPVLQYGIERFADACVTAGIDGVLIADLPPEEFEEQYKEIFESRGLSSILLVTGHTPEDRVRYIDSLCSGFLYVVSSDATTGGTLAIDGQRQAYFKRLQQMNLHNPTVVGFGISDKESFAAACMHADGAIIGSAFLREISHATALSPAIETFVTSVLGD